jgi:hypothetical protein
MLNTLYAHYLFHIHDLGKFLAAQNAYCVEILYLLWN